MYGTPSRTTRSSPRGGGGGRGSGSNKHVPDGPILDLIAVIEDTPNEHWQKRTTAFSNLVAMIPHGSAYVDSGPDWFNTPATLRHLAFPISELIKDARSTVVKRVCENLIEFFNKCQVDARYLFKDIMPAILAVHAQTVHVVRQAVQNMVIESIPEVPCKMVMPLWMERLKSDKSRTVREACALYLGRALQCWTSEEGYLTAEIWMQVGSILLRSLRDPSPHVRSYAKAALEYIQRNQPYHWEALITDPSGPVAKDMKLQKWLKTLETTNQNDIPEDLSIASRFSYNSDSRFTKSNLRISSPRVRIHSGDPNSLLDLDTPTSHQQQQQQQVPFSIAVTHTNKARVVPPLPTGRSAAAAATTTTTSSTTTPFPQALVADSPIPSTQSSPPNVTTTSPSNDAVSPRNTYTSDLEYSENTNVIEVNSPVYEGKDASTPILVLSDDSRGKSDAPGSNDIYSNGTNLSSLLADGQMILSTDDLRKLASRRRSHSSMLMQELFRKSNRFNGKPTNGEAIPEDDDADLNREDKSKDTPSEQVSTGGKAQDPPSAGSLPTSPASEDSGSAFAQPPEHMVIAIRLLRAHKSHVDQIMETLKIEMDTLRDFDRLLEEPGRPTENEVLNYFESVGLCLDQRFTVGRELQREMDRISRGEPPEI